MGNPRGVKRDFEALERRRWRARKLLQQGLNQSEVARRVKVCPQSVSRWAAQIKQGGEPALRKAGRAGRKPELAVADRQRLEQLLIAGPEQAGYDTPLWTSRRVAKLIQREFSVEYHPGHVWKLLRALGWSCQRPEGRARERNEEAIRHWKQVQWPALKKKPKKRAARSSLSTKVE